MKELKIYSEYETIRFVILDQKREIESLRYKLNMALDDLRFSELQREEYNYRLSTLIEQYADLQNKFEALTNPKE